jgi:hypothetical protein
LLQTRNPEVGMLGEEGASYKLFLEPEAKCVEVVEAEVLRLRLGEPGSHEPAIVLLERATRAFPSEARLAFVLAVERDSAGKPDGAALTRLLERFPDEWFPYARVALEKPHTREGRAEARAVLERGLARFPNALVLNFLLAGLLQSDEQWDASIAPAATALAGLLETKRNHREWSPGIGLLQNALEKRSAPPVTPQRLIGFVGNVADLATLGTGFVSGYGCFGDPGRAALVPLWFRPELVSDALAARSSTPAAPR